MSTQKILPVALITGASRGIGAACALLAAKQGWAVAVNFTSNADAGSKIVAQIKSAGGHAQAFQADVGVKADIIRMFKEIDSSMGPISGLVNNAGIVDVACRVEDMSWERVDRMMRINVLGSFACAAQAIKRMSTLHGGKGGSIVNISSAASHLGSPNQYVDYAASKGAIDTFTIGLSKEVATEGIRVNGIRPGLIATEIHASGGQPDRAQRLANQVPMQRPGTADEVAQAVVWLLSDAASYVTGTTMNVSGGR
jgi:NAD(P)-dependent dehydrogenase (short-subunit alcohol dehydrogenase family)